MDSIWSGILIVAVIIIVAVVVWKWWKKSSDKNNKKEEDVQLVQTTDPPNNSSQMTQDMTQKVPPMLFAVNDQGNLDLTDFNGRLLDSNFGPHPKVYIQLLDMVSKDIEEKSQENPGFSSLVGTTKLYESGGHEYIINFTRLV